MPDIWIQSIYNNAKVVTMDDIDVSTHLQEILDDEDTNNVILVGKGIITSTVFIRRKCYIFSLNADLYVDGDIEAIRFETGGIHVKGINFYAIKRDKKEYQRQCAINMGSTLDNSIVDCTFEGFGHCAISHAKAVGRHQGNRIQLCSFKNNRIGFAAFERGEYNQLTQCTFYTNQTAILIQGGNTNISSCIISDNKTGIMITEGDNHGHGVITGCSINHNDKPFVIQNVTYGFLINGCPIYCGNILIENSKYIKFNNCDLSHIRFQARSSNNIYVRGCHLIRFESDADPKDSMVYEYKIL
jgi:hypothetical protein